MKKIYMAIGSIGVLLLAALALGASSIFAPTHNATNTAPEESHTTSERAQAEKRSYSFNAARSATVLTLMQEKDRALLTFNTKEFAGLGVMIEEINGVSNKDGYYWILYINGTMSDTGAESAKVTAGDRVEWRYEKGY